MVPWIARFFAQPGERIFKEFYILSGAEFFAYFDGAIRFFIGSDLIELRLKDG